jgi:hypothetical protein
MLKKRESIGTTNYGNIGTATRSSRSHSCASVISGTCNISCLVIGAVFVYSTIVATGLTGVTDGPLNGLWFAFGYLMPTDAANLANVFTHSLPLFMIFAFAAAFWAIKARVKWSLLLVAVAVGCVNSFFDLLFRGAYVHRTGAKGIDIVAERGSRYLPRRKTLQNDAHA